MTSVTIGSGVTGIGGDAFRNCTSLTSIIVEAGNTVYDSRDNCNAIIETATNTMIVSCKNTIIPNSVTAIGRSAFLGYPCTSITIPNSVTIIGEWAFADCTGLSSITIGNSVTSIGNYAFYGCSGLTSVTLGSGVSSIGGDAFFGCTSLADVYCFAENVPSTIYNSAFYDSSYSSATLHVPAASLEQYQTTAPWMNFGTIVALTDEDFANAIEDVKTSKTTAETARYDIHGRLISTPQNQRSTYVNGINIIRYSDGTSKKVAVK